MATRKLGWKKPANPTCDCGHRMTPVAVLDGYGSHAEIGTFWVCDHCDDMRDMESGWPFEESYAELRDFAKLGFKTVVA